MAVASPSSADLPQWAGHPAGLRSLFFTEMWERFSYYGMRALLVLFMVDQVESGGLALSDPVATAIYGLYTAAVYLLALPGGWIVDRRLGAQKAIWIGGIVIMLGHFTLAIPSAYAFFLGLILVASGTGLLKPNISAVVGQLYRPGDGRRDAGFTLFYMGINIGAFAGSIVCGYLAENEALGWHYGFAAAGVGMLFGLWQFRRSRDLLGDAGLRPHLDPDKPGDRERIARSWRVVGTLGALIVVVVALLLTGVWRPDPVTMSRYTSGVILGLAATYFAWLFAFGGLSGDEKKRLVVIIALFLGAAMFWAGFEQAGSSLNLFADRYTDRFIGDFEMPASWLQSANPVMIILIAPLFAALWAWLAGRQLEPSTPIKFALGLILLGVGFGVMFFAARLVAAGNPVLPVWLITTYLFHTLGELALSPVGLSATTKLAPQRYVGQMMGVWFVGAALGNVLAGLLAGELAGESVAQMPDLYLQIVMTSVGSGILLLLCTPLLRKLMGDVH